MTSIGIFQILVFFGLILLVTKPVGLFMSRLFQGERTFLHPVLRPVEVIVYKLCGADLAKQVADEINKKMQEKSRKEGTSAASARCWSHLAFAPCC